jgi:hypothetical protein
MDLCFSCKEFRGLPKSTVRAVMAEHNFCYIRSRETLSGIASKSWRFSFSNFFRRSTRPLPSEDVVATGCKELDEELFALTRPKRQQQAEADRAVAVKLNEEQYADAHELFECQCCFGDYAWEEIAACSDGHFFCHACLVRSVQEGIYGQGRNLVDDKFSVKCLSSSAHPPCGATVPLDVLESVLPAEVYHNLEDRMLSDSLERSGLRLIRCPFCSYAETDELVPCTIKGPAKLFGSILGSFGCLGVGILSSSIFLIKMLLLMSLLLVPFVFATCFSPNFSERLDKTVRKVNLRRRGTRFRCGNPRCGRESCINCCKEWAAFHKCFEKEEDEARIYVERAMADAVKRTVCIPVVQ